MMKKHKPGQFVKVGNDIGVVVCMENEDNTPEDHLGIWYGEINEAGMPKYRTVPAEYCIVVEKVEVYH